MTEIWAVVMLPPDVQREEFERYYTRREEDRRKMMARLEVLLRPKHENYGLAGGRI